MTSAAPGAAARAWGDRGENPTAASPREERRGGGPGQLDLAVGRERRERVVPDVLGVMLDMGASDLHLKVGGHPVIRVDGDLIPLGELKRVRQLQSKTAGHPETGITPRGWLLRPTATCLWLVTSPSVGSLLVATWKSGVGIPRASQRLPAASRHTCNDCCTGMPDAYSIPSRPASGTWIQSGRLFISYPSS